MGIYCKGEFTDDAGYDWLVEIHDTTYSSTEFTMQLNGFTRNYDGQQSKPLLENIFVSKITARILITENDSAIEALINDIVNGGEDQFYMVVKREGVIWFAGMVLTDLCQWDDMERFYFEITATDGMNRLENFDFPIEDFADEYLTEMEAIVGALQICGIERFFGSSDVYIKNAINWYEVNSDRTRSQLEHTRIRKDSLYEDIDEGRPKRARQVIEDILKTYGATIRFENGTWWLLQPEVINSTSVDYITYDKSGGYLGTGAAANTFTIGTGGYSTNDVIVNMYLPSLYGVGTTHEGESLIRWGREENVPSPDSLTYTLNDVGNVARTLMLKTKFRFPGSSSFLGVTYVMWVVIRSGDWVYVYINTASGPRNTWLFWPVANGPLPAGYNYIAHQMSADGWVDIEFNVAIDKPASLDDITFDLILSRSSGSRISWYSYYAEIYDVTYPSQDLKLSFVANNSVYNAASMFEEVKLSYCDSDIGYVVGAKDVWDGSDWIRSTEWASGTSATSGDPLMEFLPKKCVYWQRYPRLLIQGRLLLPEYNSCNTLLWRGSRFMMLNGSFEARTRTWDGVWVEMLEQTSDVVSASRNPYRLLVNQAFDNADSNNDLIRNLGQTVTQMQNQINEMGLRLQDLQLKSDAGVEQQLIQLIPNVSLGMSVGESQQLQITKGTDGFYLEYGDVE